MDAVKLSISDNYNLTPLYMADFQSTQKILPPYTNPDLNPNQSALASGTNNPTLFPSVYGGKKRTIRRKKWSTKRKRTINCRRPRGFSQKQHCKYGRKKRKTKNRRAKR
jgi:hypothetical protein